MDVQKPKARDRGATTGSRIRFTSNILPTWARRTKSLDALPVLYLRGISAGDFQEALSALLGKDAPNMSLSLLAMFEGATVTVFDGRFGELAAWTRAGRACRRACGGQDVAWKGPERVNDNETPGLVI